MVFNGSCHARALLPLFSWFERSRIARYLPREKCSNDPSIISAGYLHHETCCQFRQYFELKSGCTAWIFGLSLCSVSNTNQAISSSKLCPQQLSVQTCVSRNIFLTWLNGWFHFTRSTILMVHWKMALYFLKGNYYWTYTPHLSLDPCSREKGFQPLGTQKKYGTITSKRLAPRPSCWRIGRFPPPGKSSCLVVLGMNSSRPVVLVGFSVDVVYQWQEFLYQKWNTMKFWNSTMYPGQKRIPNIH